MAGFTQARQQAILDAELVAGDHFMFSANGTSETASIPRIPVGSWSAATAATPSSKANAGALVGGAATGAVTVSHWAVISAASGGTQKTDWTPVNGGTPKAYAIGEQPTIAAGAFAVTLD
jgi:hypothetical protein